MSAAVDQDRNWLEFASALCGKLCHDLSSPLGTVAGTLELAAEDATQAEEAAAIAMEATGAAIRRLQLLRAAWAGDCGPLSRAQLQQLASGLPARVQADLEALADVTFDGAYARILLNMLLLGADALPGGGVVALSGNLDQGVTLTASGRSVVWGAELAAILIDPALPSGSGPRTVQASLTVRLAHAAGFRLSFLMSMAPGASQDPRLLLARR